jgi:hypothetical protein
MDFRVRQDRVCWLAAFVGDYVDFAPNLKQHNAVCWFSTHHSDRLFKDYRVNGIAIDLLAQRGGMVLHSGTPPEISKNNNLRPHGARCYTPQNLFALNRPSQ